MDIFWFLISLVISAICWLIILLNGVVPMLLIPHTLLKILEKEYKLKALFYVLAPVLFWFFIYWLVMNFNFSHNIVKKIFLSAGGKTGFLMAIFGILTNPTTRMIKEEFIENLHRNDCIKNGN